MNKYLKIAIIAILIVVLINFIIFLYYINANKSNLIDKGFTSENSKNIEHPLTIESLKNRSYGKGEITIEQDLGIIQNFKSYIISYYSDGLKLYSLLNIPNKEKPAKGFPVIVVNHGHIPQEKYSTIDSYKLVSSYYANNGFLVLKPDYRGHNKSEKGSDSRTDRLSYAVDVLNLYYLIPTLKDADFDNVFVYGHSMGGGVSLTVLEVANNVKAATLWSAVSEEFPESMLYFRRKRNPEQASVLLSQLKEIFSEDDFKKVAPINYLKYITAPIIIQHGTEDKSVPLEWSDKLAEKLKTENKYYEYYKYQNDDHNFAKGNFYKVLKKDVDFFKKYMQ